MTVLRITAQTLSRTWRSWLGFELLFQIVFLSLVGPFLKLALDTAMALSGYSYLTWENVMGFATTPMTIAVALVCMVAVTLVVLFELSGLHYVFLHDESCGRTRVRDAAIYALRRMGMAVRPANLPLIPYLLVFLPFVSLGTVGGLVRSLSIPEFIMEYVEMNTLYSVAYFAIMAVLFVGAALFLFTVIYFVAGDVTFPQAARKARAVGKHHVVADVVRLLLVSAVFSLAVGLASVVITAPLLLADGGFELWRGSNRVLAALAAIFVDAPITYATCLALLQSRECDMPEYPVAPAPVLSRNTRIAVTGAILAVAVAGCSFFIVQNAVIPLQSVQSIATRDVLLTAHRGGTFGAPENTMAAFEQAKRDGADVCELDVQQSADGVIFVSHDSNFKRISGVDKGAWELTWEQICELDATGDYWQGKAEKQSYPLLDDVISWAEANDMMLNIELKPTGHEVDFEKCVADIVNAHDFGNRCIVTSQAYDTVARMKEYAPEATCTYVTTLAYGDICQLDAADAFSVEETSATPVLVGYLHAHGKPVLAWVVNSEPSMLRVIGNGVDNVITDNVPLGRRVIDEANDQTIAGRLFNAAAAALS